MSRAELVFFLRQAAVGLRLQLVRNAVSVTCIALALLLMATLVGAAANAQRVLEAARDEALIVVHLAADLSPEAAQELATALALREGVDGVSLVTPQQALERVEVILGGGFGIADILEGYNPFAYAVEVSVLPEAAAVVAAYAAGLAEVDSVRDNQAILEPLARLTAVARGAGTAALVGTLVITLALVSHIIQLGVLAARRDIETLRLLGASEWFVSLPFVLQGGMLGGLGAAVTICILLAAGPGVYARLTAALPFLPWLSPAPLLANLALLVLPVGLLAGALGSLVALGVRR